jgi:hypothetical protein
MIQGTDQNEWLIIVNPNAGNGKGEKDWDKISELLSKEVRDMPLTSHLKLLLKVSEK